MAPKKKQKKKWYKVSFKRSSQNWLTQEPFGFHCQGVFIWYSVTKLVDNLLLKIRCRFFASVHLIIEIVIKKGGGSRPVEALATLYAIKKVLNSTRPKFILGPA